MALYAGYAPETGNSESLELLIVHTIIAHSGIAVYASTVRDLHINQAEPSQEVIMMHNSSPLHSVDPSHFCTE